MDIDKINRRIKAFGGNTKPGQLGYIFNPASLFEPIESAVGAAKTSQRFSSK